MPPKSLSLNAGVSVNLRPLCAHGHSVSSFALGTVNFAHPSCSTAVLGFSFGKSRSLEKLLIFPSAIPSRTLLAPGHALVCLFS